MIQASAFVTYSAVDPTILVTVTTQVTYESDVDKARELMVEEARRPPANLAREGFPKTWVMDYDDNGVILRLRFPVKDQATDFPTQKDLLYSTRKRFTETGIQIPYPTRPLITD